MSSYPVAQYRNSSQPRYPPAFKPGTLPVPANDNIPKPANDNWRSPLPRARVNANIPKWSTAAKIARGSGRVLGRAVPILGWIVAGLEVYSYALPRIISMGGFTFDHTCNPGVPMGQIAPSSNPGCPAASAVKGNPIWEVNPILGAQWLYYRGLTTPSTTGAIRYKTLDVYFKPAGVQTRPVVAPPWFVPRPPELNPNTPARPRPRTRPRQRPRNRPSFPGLPFEPIAEPNGQPRTPLPRSQTLTITPGIKGQVSSNPYIARRPPGPGVKERKVKSNAPGLLLMLQKIAHTATEAIDFIDALHDALPKRFQAKGDATPQQKAQAVYRHINEIDVELAIRNLIINHITDSVIGRSNAAVKKWATDNGIILGPYGLGYKL